MEYLNEVSSTIGNPQYHNYSEFSESDSEDANDGDLEDETDEVLVNFTLYACWLERRHMSSYHVGMLKCAVLA